MLVFKQKRFLKFINRESIAILNFLSLTNRRRSKNLLLTSYPSSFFAKQKKSIILRHVTVESNTSKKFFVKNSRIDNQRRIGSQCRIGSQNNTLSFIHTN